MSDKDLNAILKASGLGLSSLSGPQRVQVELRTAALDEAQRGQLEACGLHIDKSIGNKVFGAIDSGKRAGLLKLEMVAGVEDVVQLKPHRPPS